MNKKTKAIIYFIALCSVFALSKLNADDSNVDTKQTIPMTPSPPELMCAGLAGHHSYIPCVEKAYIRYEKDWMEFTERSEKNDKQSS